MAHVQETQLKAPRRLWPSEGVVLKSIFWLLLGATIAFVGYDVQELQRRADMPLPGAVEQTAPVVTTPPEDDDHERLYLPFAAPTRDSELPPHMPGVGAPEPDALSQRMRFTRGPSGAASAVGRIEPGSADDLAQFLEAQSGEVSVLYLHSPGGLVGDALAMARALREAGVDTAAPDHAYCASSCPILLSGGVTRSVGEKAWVGVHRVFPAATRPGDLSDGMAEGQAISAEVQAHLVEMGVDAALWIHAMQTPSDRLYYLTPEQMEEYRLATETLR